MNRYFLTTIAIITITAIAFTACAKKSETQTAFNIYSIWRYVNSADVEHGETWVNDGEKSIAIFEDGEYAVVISGSYAWRGVLHDRGDYSYTFNAVTRLDYETGIVYNVEGQAPYTFVLKYDPQTRQLISADGTVEEYYEWFSESGFVPDIGFSNTHQEILTVDLSAFTGTWVNSEEGTYTIPQPQSWENEFPGGFKQFENYYTWWHPAGDFGINLVPIGADLEFVSSDTTKMRLITENLHTPPVVYYREGETPAQSWNNTADKLGERVWQFQSGDLIYFFKHYRELIIIDFRNDGNVYVTDQNIDRSSFTVSGRWHTYNEVSSITGSGELEIRPNTEGLSAMRSELNFSYQIKGNLLTITDDEGFTATYYEIFPYG